MGVRRAAAVAAARLSGAASRALSRGGGTALPGLVATKLDPHIIRDLAGQIPAGSMVVSGTNGKTTTARLLAAILTDTGHRPLRNQSGSNLPRGLASSLVQETTLLGDIRPDDRAIGLFEVDEAALPDVVATIRPRALLLLNLFRDQLDRYGEVATVATLWTRAIASLPTETSLAANADDPLVANVALQAARAALYFGIESADRVAEHSEHASDVKSCPRCSGPITYAVSFLGHLGHYSCTTCTFQRPSPTVYASRVRLNGIQGSSFHLTAGAEGIDATVRLPGMYNVYNAVAAAAAASSLGIDLQSIATSLANATPAFGRMERLEVEGRTVFLALAKNPAGLNEVIRTLRESDPQLHLLMMLNDNTADGRDVSWIWDADIEMLSHGVHSVVFGGRRAEDIALRFKYAGVTVEGSCPQWDIEHDTERAFRVALAYTPVGSYLFVVPTYTAMLDVRNVLVRLRYVKSYWEE